jgi:hypothetical protein
MDRLMLHFGAASVLFDKKELQILLNFIYRIGAAREIDDYSDETEEIVGYMYEWLLQLDPRIGEEIKATAKYFEEDL